MIPSLTAIILAFAWLLYESDWLRIRLPVGTVTQGNYAKVYRIADAIYTKEGSYMAFGVSRIDRTIHYHATRRQYEARGDTILSPGIEEPLCGWEWVLNHQHPLVDYLIQIEAWGVKNTITLDSRNPKMEATLKEVCKLALAKPRRKSKPRKVKGQTFNYQRGLAT